VEAAAPPGVREFRVDAVGAEQVLSETAVRKLVAAELVEQG
jgi:hypothetical protein